MAWNLFWIFPFFPFEWDTYTHNKKSKFMIVYEIK